MKLEQFFVVDKLIACGTIEVNVWCTRLKMTNLNVSWSSTGEEVLSVWKAKCLISLHSLPSSPTTTTPLTLKGGQCRIGWICPNRVHGSSAALWIRSRMVEEALAFRLRGVKRREDTLPYDSFKPWMIRPGKWFSAIQRKHAYTYIYIFFLVHVHYTHCRPNRPEYISRSGTAVSAFRL